MHVVSIRLLCTLWLHGRFIWLSLIFNMKCQVWRCPMYMCMCIIQFNVDNEDVDTKHRCQHKCVHLRKRNEVKNISRNVLLLALLSVIAIHSIQCRTHTKLLHCLKRTMHEQELHCTVLLRIVFSAIQFGPNEKITENDNKVIGNQWKFKQCVQPVDNSFFSVIFSAFFSLF